MQVPSTIVPFIESHLPSFYGEEGPLFIKFMEAYYEWLGETVDRQVLANRDIDLAAEAFLANFKNTYLPNITFDSVTNKRLLVKNIMDVYRSKGTTRGIELFMRLVYGKDSEVYFPGDDVLRASAAEWVLPRFIEVSRSPYTSDFVGKIITGSQSGASCFVESFIERRTQADRIDVLNVSNVNGEFVIGEALMVDAIYDNSPIIVGSPRTGTIVNGGSNFEMHQDLTFKNARGNYGIARVTGIDDNGAITKVKIVESGIGFTDQSLVYLQYGSGITGATMNVTNYSVGRLLGYWNHGSGIGEAHIHDSDYWQEYSYDVLSALSFDKYSTALKAVLHVAGKRAFGSVRITGIGNIAALLSGSASLEERQILIDYALALDFVNDSYWKSGTRYGQGDDYPISNTPGLSFTRSGPIGAPELVDQTGNYGPEQFLDPTMHSLPGWIATNCTVNQTGVGTLLTKTADGMSYTGAATNRIEYGMYRIRARITCSERARVGSTGLAGSYPNNFLWMTSVPGTFDIDVLGSSAFGTGFLDFQFSCADNLTWAANGATMRIESFSVVKVGAKVSWASDSEVNRNSAGYAAYVALTNNMAFSQDPASGYSIANTFVNNVAVAPDGTTTMDRVVPDVSNTPNHLFGQLSAIGAGTFTHSIFAKADGYSRIWIGAYDGTTWNTVGFDLANGTVLAGAEGATIGYIVPYGNGLYRCIVVTTTAGSYGSGGGMVAFPKPASVTNKDTSFAGDGVSGVQVWQHQVIAGNFPDGGPLIRTTSAAVAVGASSLVVTDAVGADADQIFFARVGANAGSGQYVQWNDGTSNNTIWLYGAGGAVNVVVGGSSVYNVGVGSAEALTIGVRRKAGKWSMFYKLGSAATVVGAETTAAFPSLTAANVGCSLSGGQPNTLIKGVYRRLGTFSDAQVQAIVDEL
jgi:hypothetical protein